MDKQTKKLWLDGLRSGSFQQCQDALETIDGYCCLGVLLVVTGHKPEEEVPFADPESSEWKCQVFADVEELSANALEFFGLPATVHAEAVRRNDSGESFEQIADWLEREL